MRRRRSCGFLRFRRQAHSGRRRAKWWVTANGDVPSENGLRAMQRLYEDAKSKSDDITLRHLRQRMLGDDRTKQYATSDAATFFRKRVADLEKDETTRHKAELE